jgi:small subunit ribosomal protein S1
VVDVVVDRVEPFGVFVSWPAGRGLIPGRELGIPRGTDLRRQFREGAAFKAVVIDIRDDGKITLSKTAVERAEERADMDAYRQQASPPSGRGFGTLGDLFRDKLGR